MAEILLPVALVVLGVAVIGGAAVVGALLASRASKSPGFEALAAGLAEHERKLTELSNLPTTWEKIREDLGDKADVMERRARRVAAHESRERRGPPEFERPRTREEEIQAARQRWQGGH